jgi:multidrug efflux pump subunit AcrA (membrane-fusion protein)
VEPQRNAWLRRFRQKAAREEALLERGKAPESRITSPLQRSAAKLIAGFFALMLLFTIISRAADGMTIALCQAEQPKSGAITNRTELSGVIRPLEDLDILLPGSLYIAAVKAEAGQKVSKGDVLLEFDMDDVETQLDDPENSLAIAEAKLAIVENAAPPPDDTVVANAQLSLQQAQDDYDRQSAKSNRSKSRAQEDYNSAAYDLSTANANYNTALSDAKADMVKAALDKRDSAQRALTDAQAAADEAIATAKYNYDKALNSANPDPLEVSRAYDAWQSAISKQEIKTADAQAACNTAAAEYSDALAGKNLDAQQAVVAAQNAVKTAEKSLSQAKRSLEDSGATADDQLLSASRAVSKAERDLEQAKKDAAEKARSAENSQTQSSIDEITQRAQIAALKKTIAALQELWDMQGQLQAPTDGTVQAIAQTGKTQEKTAVATLSRNDMGFQFEAKLSSVSAEQLLVGDSGNLSYKSDGVTQRTTATVESIGAADEEGNCVVVATLPEGSYPSGANGSVTIASTGERQNTCLSVSALRSDNDGDYVFVLDEKKTVTGLEYTAKRVDVTILDRDSSLASVQAGLGQNDKVITSVDKPIAEGDRVRLDESES